MRKTNTISAIIYVGLSLITSLVFLAAASFGGYNNVERIGGMVWVFVLSNIILMPLVIPAVRRRLSRAD